MTAVELAASPQWRLDAEGGTLVATAGADLRYAFPDLGPAVAAEVLRAWAGKRLDRRSLSVAAGEVVDQLAGLGAVRAVPAAAAVPLAVEVRFVHRPDEQVAAHLAGPGGGAAGLVVLVRTDGTLAELAEVAAGVDGAHLVVDLAYHHTVSLGPLVVPGQTACAGCLAGRVAARWGDRPPPAEPAAASSPVAGALVAHEVAKVAAGTSLLVNRTVALDLASWRSVDEAVLRLPWCPHCGTGGGRDGRRPLPWAP